MIRTLLASISEHDEMQDEPDEAPCSPSRLVIFIIKLNNCSVPVEVLSSREVHVMLR